MATPLSADLGSWLPLVIIVVAVIGNLVGVLRRRGAMQRDASAAQGSDLSQSSSDLSGQSMDSAKAMDASNEVFAQIQAANRAAATLTVSATRAAAAAQRPTTATVTRVGQALAATLENVLDARTAQDAVSGLPPPVAHRQGIQGLPAALHAPGGLASAVLSATIIGPPTALKTAPQEPGGW